MVHKKYKFKPSVFHTISAMIDIKMIKIAQNDRTMSTPPVHIIMNQK